MHIFIIKFLKHNGDSVNSLIMFAQLPPPPPQPVLRNNAIPILWEEEETLKFHPLITSPCQDIFPVFTVYLVSYPIVPGCLLTKLGTRLSNVKMLMSENIIFIQLTMVEARYFLQNLSLFLILTEVEEVPLQHDVIVYLNPSAAGVVLS